MFSIAVTAAILLASSLPSVNGHMALWHPSMYGFAEPYLPVTPMVDLPLSKWWFHGYANDKPSSSMKITAGQPLTVEIACGKEHTTYGEHPSPHACPIDAGAYHAGGVSGQASGWESNSDADLMGCALAISPTKGALSTSPEDFTIMSILENCIKTRDTTFQIPSTLPECPDGECTCAWFWQGRTTVREMYMTGFRCTVEGGVVGGVYPKAVVPRKGKIDGATQPIYWANEGTNLDYEPTYETRPSYNSKFGWVDGAQTGAFGKAGAAGGDGGEGSAGNSSSTPSSSKSSPVSSSSSPVKAISKASSAPSKLPSMDEGVSIAETTPAPVVSDKSIIAADEKSANTRTNSPSPVSQPTTAPIVKSSDISPSSTPELSSPIKASTGGSSPIQESKSAAIPKSSSEIKDDSNSESALHPVGTASESEDAGSEVWKDIYGGGGRDRWSGKKGGCPAGERRKRNHRSRQ